MFVCGCSSDESRARPFAHGTLQQFKLVEGATRLTKTWVAFGTSQAFGQSLLTKEDSLFRFAGQRKQVVECNSLL